MFKPVKLSILGNKKDSCTTDTLFNNTHSAFSETRTFFREYLELGHYSIRICEDPSEFHSKPVLSGRLLFLKVFHNDIFFHVQVYSKKLHNDCFIIRICKTSFKKVLPATEEDIADRKYRFFSIVKTRNL